MSTVIRSEKHMIKNSKVLDELCFISKNLYNQANFLVRQTFIETSKQKKQGLVEHATYLNYYDMERKIKDCRDYEEYCMLPAQARQSTLKLLDKNWKSFFRSIKDFMKNPKEIQRKAKYS